MDRRTRRPVGLRGWVRNRPDGSVEAVLAGAPAAVERALDHMQSGPAAARVERIETRDVTEEEAALLPSDGGFAILSDG